MENIRTGSHSRFDIKYHFVWLTKYRKQILTSEVGFRFQDSQEPGDGGDNFQISSGGEESV